jgi:hypothetical protein
MLRLLLRPIPPGYMPRGVLPDDKKFSLTGKLKIARQCRTISRVPMDEIIITLGEFCAPSPY